MYNIVAHDMGDRQFVEQRHINTIFLDACDKGDTCMVELLLQYPNVDPSCSSNKAIGNSALHGWTDITKKLLMDPRTRSIDGIDGCGHALEFAIKNARIEVIDLLIQDARINTQKALWYACDYGQIDVLNHLLKNSQLVDSLSDTNVMTFRRTGDDYGTCSYSCGAMRALMTSAIVRGHDYIVDRLLCDHRIKYCVSFGLSLRCNTKVHNDHENLLCCPGILFGVDYSEYNRTGRVSEARKRWYWDRAVTMRDLHDELIATQQTIMDKQQPTRISHPPVSQMEPRVVCE